jgi:signal peptidase II
LKANWRHGRPEGPLSAFGLTIIAAIIAVDQAAKAWATVALPPGVSIDLLPILALLRVENAGIAFSIFAGSGLPLVALTLVVSAAVLVVWLTTREGGRLATAGFAMILGGAIGNLIDRIRLGYVIDFLWLHLGDVTLFVFNLADAALTLGPALLIIAYLWPAAPAAAD